MRQIYTLLSILSGFFAPIGYAFLEHRSLLTTIADQPTSLLYIFAFIMTLVAFHNLDTYFDKGIGRHFYRTAFVYRKIKLVFWLGAVYFLISFVGSYSASINDLLLVVLIGQLVGSSFGYLATNHWVNQQTQLQD